MRISNINPKYLKNGDYEKLLALKVVPFFKGKVRLAKEEEVSLIESTFNQKLERKDGFIPIIWVEQEGDMKVKKIISKSKDGEKMEVIAEVYNGRLKTVHIQKHSKDWKFCAGYEKGRMILRSIEDKK